MKNFIIAAVLAIAVAAGAYYAGVHVTSAKYDLQISQDNDKALKKLNAANDQVRALEDSMRTTVDERTAQLKKEADDAKNDRDNFIAGVRNGTIRLSIPIVAHGVSQSAADPAAAGQSEQARAELDPAAAETLAAIAGTGDDAIRDLNACIDIYNDVRNAFNVQAK